MPQASFLVGLIGSGIGPSLSPALHEREAGRQGLRCHYRLIDIDRLGVGPEAVGDLVRAARDLGFDGLNITHPCKQLVIGHLDALAPQAEALGAVNTVVFEDGRAVEDVVAVARRFRAAGGRLLRVPANYYDDLAARYEFTDGELGTYRELGILYDRDAGGAFRHCYTETVGRVFFELVQRDAGHRGYGVQNAPVRLAAQHAAGRPVR